MSTALTIKDRLNSQALKVEVARALPKHLTPDRFLRIAITATTRNPKLAECDQASFFGALMTLSQLGLEPDGRLAHLIPFENRKRGVTECQLIVDYKGLVDLAYRSGKVSNLHADTVCENDEFEFNKGELVNHKIDFRRPRGDVYAVYALCRFKDGSEKVEVMTRDAVEAIRSRSRAKDSGPWVTDWDEMAKKTVFKRLSKWLPLSPEFNDAVEADDDKQVIDVESTVEPEKPKRGRPATVKVEDAPHSDRNDGHLFAANPSLPKSVDVEEPAPGYAPKRSGLSMAFQAAMIKAKITWDAFLPVWAIKYSERASEVTGFADLTDEEIQDINDRMDVKDGIIAWKTGGAR